MRIAFISGAPSASTGSMQGPMALAPTAVTSLGPDPAVGKLVADEGEVVPPVFARTVLGPAGMRHLQSVRLRRGGEDGAVVGDEHALRFEGADIDAEIVRHWMKSSRSRLNFPSMRGRAATRSRVRPTRSARSQTSSEE